MCEYKYDYIVVSVDAYDEIRAELLDKGIEEKKIKSLDVLLSGIVEEKYLRKRILVIVHSLNTSGGFIAPYNACRVMLERGYNVVLATPYVENESYTEDIIMNGIEIRIMPSLPYIGVTEIESIKEFDAVILNTVKYIKCAFEISRYVETILWLHDPSTAYRHVSSIDYYKKNNNLKIMGVSVVANKLFEINPNIKCDGVLPYGLYDFYNSATEKNKKSYFCFDWTYWSNKKSNRIY